MASKTILTGRVGQEPETRTLEGGNNVTSFTLATTERWKDKEGNKKEETEWHQIVIWGKLAEIAAQYVRKGDLLNVTGKNKTDKYEKDGVTHYRTKVVCNEMELLTSKKDKEQGGSVKQPQPSNKEAPPPEIDDLPF